VRLRGIAGPALWALLVLLAWPWAAEAAPAGVWSRLGLAIQPVASPALAQAPQSYPESLLATPGSLDRGKSALLTLPHNLEMNISILYRRDPAQLNPSGPSDLLHNYALNYRLLPNLWVGLNGYLYHPSDEGFNFPRPLHRRVMGLGPGLKYNLGRWNFVFKTQVESGGPKGEDVQNWFRVWYAF